VRASRPQEARGAHVNTRDRFAHRAWGADVATEGGSNNQDKEEQ
jgi:hypothetical protein